MEISIQYLAGMVDADGCILSHKSGKIYRYPRLQVTNTSWKLIEELISNFGGHSVKRHVKGKGTFINRQDCYDWRIDGNSARKLIEKLIPYLVIKKEKALQVLINDSKNGFRDFSGA